MESLSSSSSSFPLIAGVASCVAAVVVGSLVVWQRQQQSSSSRNNTAAAAPPLPPHATSWVPYLGAGWAMGQKGLLGFVRSTAPDLCQVFTATVLGERCLFLADPADLASIFKAKYQAYLDDASLQKQFVRNDLGSNAAQVQEMYAADVLKVSKQQYHHYLFKGPELERSMKLVGKFFADWVPLVASNDTWMTTGLYHLVASAIFKASTGPFLSTAVAQSDEAFENFLAFDKGVIPLYNNVPTFLLSSAVKARDGLLRLVHSQEYWNQASPLMQERKKSLNMSGEALDRANLGLLWASSGNSVPAVFWLVTHLLEDAQAWQACLAQVKDVIAKRNNKEQQDGFTLEELDQMTLLESAFSESLRMYQANVTARNVVQGFSLETASGETYWIPEGTKFMAIWSVLHLDPHVHKDPEEFRYDRFVDKKQTYTFANGKVLNHDPIIPFGGGLHLCPGYVKHFIHPMLQLVFRTSHFSVLYFCSSPWRFTEGEGPQNYLDADSDKR